MYKSLIITIFVTLLLSQIIYAESNFVYALTLKYDGQTLTNEGLKLIEGEAPSVIDQEGDEFLLKILSFEEKELYSFNFTINTIILTEPLPEWFDDEGNQIVVPEEAYTEIQETVTVLIFPHFYNAKSIEIYSQNGEKLLTVDVSKYSKRENVTVNSNYIFYILGLVIIVLLAIVFFKTKNKKHKKKK